MEFEYNPFHDAGITNYEQYKLYPFLIFGTLNTIKNRITQQIKQIKSGHFFSERMIILGERGIGKTSSLFFIHDLLKENNIKSFLFSRLIENEPHLVAQLNKAPSGEVIDVGFKERKTLKGLTGEPIYMLIDFPDTIETKQFKKFLEFLWSLMTHKSYNKINLIFSMNKSHYEKSFSYSEMFGKFLSLRLEKLDMLECEKLISSRLKKVDKKLKDVFSYDVQEVIFNYSKGIPRNVISACSLLVDNSNGVKEMGINYAKEILKEKYIEQVINDRVTDLELKRVYKQMANILEKDFNGTAKSQEDYVKRVMELVNLGRNSVLARIGDLVRFGIFKLYRGGYNRVNKIISFN